MVGAAFTVHRAAATAGAEEGKMCLLRTRHATLFVPQSSLIFSLTRHSRNPKGEVEGILKCLTDAWRPRTQRMGRRKMGRASFAGERQSPFLQWCGRGLRRPHFASGAARGARKRMRQNAGGSMGAIQQLEQNSTR